MLQVTCANSSVLSYAGALGFCLIITLANCSRKGNIHL